MRLCTLRLDGTETAAVVTDQGIVPVARINSYLGRAWSTDLYALLRQGLTLNLLRDAERTPDALAPDTVHYAPLYRHPRKIWGIGLNYKDHAADLSAPFPTEPASFMKGDHTIIGPGDAIELPPESERVTAEAELGVISSGPNEKKVSKFFARVRKRGLRCRISSAVMSVIRQYPAM